MNWKSEAIEQLTKYDAMVEATKNIPREIRRLESDAAALVGGSVITSPTGKTKGPGDDRIINNLVKREQLQNSYKNAVAWVETTDRAMSVLTPEEKNILQQMYVRPQRGVILKLCEELGIEQSSVYRRRDQALYRFTIALYGTA